MRRLVYSVISAGLLSTGLLLAGSTAAPAVQADQSLYTDSLQNGWSNYSWATVNLSSPSPTHTGADAISVDAGAYQALYLHHAAFDSTPYTSLVFWINGGAAGGQTVQVAGTLNGTSQTSYPLPALAANTWTQVVIPLSALGVDGKTTFDGIWIQSTSGSTEPVFYVDDAALTNVPPADPSQIVVDAAASQHPISPLIYGVAFGSAATLSDLNAPLNRSGGNAETRYNWKLNATNHASDYFFESIGSSSAIPGQDGDDFVSSSKAAGAQSMLTIPTIGWVANLGPNRSILGAFSVAKYGAQQSVDKYRTDIGNGVKPDGKTLIVGNDPNDANIPADVNFQGGWIDHLVSTWGQASKGGVSYYLMDNEPSLWNSTHRDVHPVGQTMSEALNDIETYGARVKSADPTAQVVGPEEWGWPGYFSSGYDQQYSAAHNYQGSPDKDSHKVAGQPELDYYPWLLQQLAAHDQQIGQRTLDVFSAHIYPQGGDGGDLTDDKTSLLRNRSTRALWDPNYTDESWINSKINLIPRLKDWVNTYYPGTKIGITEYNWGAEADISGATAQADILGIFGREGLDLATRWTTPASSTPVYSAMKMYRNYDGKKSVFGDTSVLDTAASPDNVSSFAAVRASDGALTIMVINKELHTSSPINLTLKNFSAGTAAQTWQLTGTNSITRLADTPVAGGLLTTSSRAQSITTSVPAQSITLYVLPLVWIPIASQTVILTPTADTFVQAGAYANTRHGTSALLGVEGLGTHASLHNQVSYLKFDLSQVTRTPKSAVLTLTLTSADQKVRSAVPCKLYGVANCAWTETGLTWNKASATESLNGLSLLSTGTYVGTTTVGPKLGTYTWDVSSYLKGQAGKVVTLQILDESRTGAYCGFASKEAAAGEPTLSVTY